MHFFKLKRKAALIAAMLAILSAVSARAAVGEPIYITGTLINTSCVMNTSGNTTNSWDERYTYSFTGGGYAKTMTYQDGIYHYTFTCPASPTSKGFSMSMAAGTGGDGAYTLWDKNGLNISNTVYGSGMSWATNGTSGLSLDTKYLVDHSSSKGESPRNIKGLVAGRTYTIYLRGSFIGNQGSSPSYNDTDYNDFVWVKEGGYDPSEAQEHLYLAGRITDAGLGISENGTTAFNSANTEEFAYNATDQCYYYTFKAGAASYYYSLSQFSLPAGYTISSWTTPGFASNSTLSATDKTVHNVYYDVWRLNGVKAGSDIVAKGAAASLSRFADVEQQISGLTVGKYYRICVSLQDMEIWVEEAPDTDLYIMGPLVSERSVAYNDLHDQNANTESFTRANAYRMSKGAAGTFYYTFTAKSATNDNYFVLSKDVSDYPNFLYWKRNAVCTDQPTYGWSISTEVSYPTKVDYGERRFNIPAGETYTLYVSADGQYIWAMPGEYSALNADPSQLIYVKPEWTGASSAFNGLAYNGTALIGVMPPAADGNWYYRATTNVSRNGNGANSTDNNQRFNLHYGDPSCAETSRISAQYMISSDPLSADNTRYALYSRLGQGGAQNIKTTLTDVQLCIDSNRNWLWIHEYANEPIYAKATGEEPVAMGHTGGILGTQYTIGVPDGTAKTYSISRYKDESDTHPGGFASGQVYFEAPSIALGNTVNTTSTGYPTLSVGAQHYGAQFIYNPYTGTVEFTGSANPTLFITGPIAGHGLTKGTNASYALNNVESFDNVDFGGNTYLYYTFTYNSSTAGLSGNNVAADVFTISKKAGDLAAWNEGCLRPVGTVEANALLVGAEYTLQATDEAVRHLRYANVAISNAPDLIDGKTYTIVVTGDFATLRVIEGSAAEAIALLQPSMTNFWVNGSVNGNTGSFSIVQEALKVTGGTPIRMSFDSTSGLYFYRITQGTGSQTTQGFAIYDNPECNVSGLWTASNHKSSDILNVDGSKYVFVNDPDGGCQRLNDYNNVTVYFDPTNERMWIAPNTEHTPIHLSLDDATLKSTTRDGNKYIYVYDLEDNASDSTVKFSLFGNDVKDGVVVANTAFTNADMLQFASSSLNFDVPELIMALPSAIMTLAGGTPTYTELTLPAHYGAKLTVTIDYDDLLGAGSNVLLEGSNTPPEIPLYICGHVTNNFAHNYPGAGKEYSFLPYNTDVNNSGNSRGENVYNPNNAHTNIRRMTYGPVMDYSGDEPTVVVKNGNPVYEYTYTFAGARWSAFEISTGCQYASQEKPGNTVYYDVAGNAFYNTYWVQGMVVYKPNNAIGLDTSWPMPMDPIPYNMSYDEIVSGNHQFNTKRGRDAGARDMIINGYNPDYIYTIHVSDDLKKMYITEQPVHMPLKAEDFFQEFEVYDTQPVSHYFVVGSRTSDWRLLPEWELKHRPGDAANEYSLAGRFMYDGYMGIAKVDNYYDYVMHFYEKYSNADPTNVDDQIYTGWEGKIHGGTPNPNIDLKSYGRSGALHYKDDVYTHNYLNSITWNFDRNVDFAGDNYEYTSENGEPSKRMMRYALPWLVDRMVVTTESGKLNGEPTMLSSYGIDGSESAAAYDRFMDARTFSFMGSDVNYAADYNFGADHPFGTRNLRTMTSTYKAEGIHSTKGLNNVSEKNWANAWIQYDRNGTPYYDGYGNVLYLTAFDKTWLNAHPVKFDLNTAHGTLEYSSENLIFEEPDLNDTTDPYWWVYRQHPNSYAEPTTAAPGAVGGTVIGKREGNATYPYSMVAEDAVNTTSDQNHYSYQERLVDENYAEATPINYTGMFNNQDFTVTNHEGTYVPNAITTANQHVGSPWRCYVVKDVWLLGDFMVWSGWGGGLASAEGTFKQPGIYNDLLNNNGQDIDDACTPANNMRLYFGNFGHNQHDCFYEVMGHDVFTTATTVNYGDNPKLLYKTYRDVDNANFRTQDADFNPATGESSGDPVHFDRVILWYNTTTDRSRSSAQNGVLQFIREDMAPQAKAYHESSSNDHLYVNWNIADFTKTITEGGEVESRYSDYTVDSYTITRYHYVDGVPTVYREFDPIEPETTLTVGEILAGVPGTSVVTFHDPYSLPEGEYWYTVTVTLNDGEGNTTSKTAVTNILSVSNAGIPLAVDAEQEKDGNLWSFNVHVTTSIEDESLFRMTSHSTGSSSNYTVAEDAAYVSLVIDASTKEKIEHASSMEIVNPYDMVLWRRGESGDNLNFSSLFNYDQTAARYDYIGFGLNRANMASHGRWSDILNMASGTTVEGDVLWTPVVPVKTHDSANGREYPSKLYLMGTVATQGNGYWDTRIGTPAASYNGMYNFRNIVIENSGDGYGYFNFVESLTQTHDWNWVGNRYGSSFMKNELIASGRSNIGIGSGDNSFKLLPGVYDIVVDLQNYTMEIAEVTNEADLKAMYGLSEIENYEIRFDLQQYYARSAGTIHHETTSIDDLKLLQWPEVIFHNVQPTENVAGGESQYSFTSHIGPEEGTVGIAVGDDAAGNPMVKVKTFEELWLANLGLQDDETSTGVYVPTPVLAMTAELRKSSLTPSYNDVDYTNADHYKLMPAGAVANTSGSGNYGARAVNPVHYPAVNEVGGKLNVVSFPVTEEVLRNVGIGFTNLNVGMRGGVRMTTDALAEPARRIDASDRPTADFDGTLTHMPVPATEVTTVNPTPASNSGAATAHYELPTGSVVYTATTVPCYSSGMWDVTAARTATATATLNIADIHPQFSIVNNGSVDQVMWVARHDNRINNYLSRLGFALEATGVPTDLYTYYGVNVETRAGNNNWTFWQDMGQAGTPLYHRENGWGNIGTRIRPIHDAANTQYVNYDALADENATYDDATHNWSRMAAETNYLPVLFEPLVIGTTMEAVQNATPALTVDVQPYVIVPLVASTAQSFTLETGNNPIAMPGLLSAPAKTPMQLLHTGVSTLAVKAPLVSINLAGVTGTTELDDEMIDTNEYAPVYYNLQGIEVPEPVSGNIYLVRRGPVTTKEYYK